MVTPGSNFTIRDALPADFASVEAILRRAGLPTEDLNPGLVGFSVAFAGPNPDEHCLVGAAGVERHGAVALLRSVVVDPAHQSAGLGRQLCERLLESTARGGIRDLYLLTTTAPEFFVRLGFDELPRESAPAAIRETEEFGRLCPDSAVLMRRSLLA